MQETRLDRFGLLRMDEEDCWAFLAQHHVGRVAIVQMGRPIIYPVNYALDGRSVVFRTAPGAKLVAAGIGAEAAFEVDESSDRLETGTSVIVHGHLHEVEAASERERLATLPIRPWAAGVRDRFVRVEPEWITGRRIEPSGP